MNRPHGIFVNASFAIALLTATVTAAAAPPPPPDLESDQSRFQLRQAVQQNRRFEAAGLRILSPPTNGGQCVIDMAGQFGPPPGQRGASGSYRLLEIQRWEIAAVPIATGRNPLRYAVQWSTRGNGVRHDDNGVGARNDWTFAVSGAANTQLIATRVASTGDWLVQAAPASSANGVTVTQQQTITGTMPRMPVTTQSVASAVAYPGMTVAAATAGNPSRLIQTRTFRVPQEMNWGYPRPAYATGTIACSWTIGVGP